MDTELKYFDTTINAVIRSSGEIPATGGQLLLIPQGTTTSTRIGRKIMICAIQLNSVAYMDGTISDQIIRVCLFQDAQANGSAPSFTDVFSSNNLFSHPNPFNENRFQLLEDLYITLEATTGSPTTTYSPNYKIKRLDAPLYMEVDYSGTTGALSEIRSNNLFLTVQGLSDNASVFTGIFRVWYTDE